MVDARTNKELTGETTSASTPRTEPTGRKFHRPKESHKRWNEEGATGNGATIVDPGQPPMEHPLTSAQRETSVSHKRMRCSKSQTLGFCMYLPWTDHSICHGQLSQTSLCTCSSASHTTHPFCYLP